MALEPLIEHQLSGQYPNNYSMHDIGTHLPNATGHSDGNDEYMPVEECGDMLIMGLAVVNALKTGLADVVCDASSVRTKDTTHNTLALAVDKDGYDECFSASPERTARLWAERSYKLWKLWAGYLVRETLIPRNQPSTDDFAGWLANQTNIALKGIIGIRAMSELSDLVGEKEDAQYYRDISETLHR